MDKGQEAEKEGDGSRSAGPGTKSGRRWKSGDAGRTVQVEYQDEGRRRLGRKTLSHRKIASLSKQVLAMTVKTVLFDLLA